jgi:formylglycine-generating enzyme required for sulfatase activity
LAGSRFRVGHIQDVSGEVTIAGRDIYKGYTVEQVSALLEQINTTFQPRPFDGRPPYKGLHVFEESDADLFFGREQLVKDLLRRLPESRALFITGPSGSGKSSLVRAGLIPALKRGEIGVMRSELWCFETMEPGPTPLNELARVVSSLAGALNAGEDIRLKGPGDPTVFAQWCEIGLGEGGNKRLILFVDQFEELFTQVGDETQRQAFLRLLTTALRAENGRVICLFALRSDFVSNCAEYPELNTLLNRQSAFVQVGAMQPDELVSAIAQPALRVSLKIDPKLIAQIINDMKGEPGVLPLMQFALNDLFQAQQDRGGLIDLQLRDYLQRGGLHKALERHADAEFGRLTEPERALTENLFKGLVEVAHDAPVTRRTARMDEFDVPEANRVVFESVVRRLADARLISTDEDQATGRTITLAHEKLIEAWPWLRQLVEDNRVLIQLHNQILEDAREWESHGKDRSYLYGGARLASTRERVTAKKILLSGPAQAFVEAGIELEEARRWQEEGRRQKELDDARQLTEMAEGRLRAEQRARRGWQVMVGVLAFLVIGALALLARPYVLRAMAQGEMTDISGGPVVIGTDRTEASDIERPAWTANLDPFAIDRYEVSNYQYGLCVSARICSEPKDPTRLYDSRYATQPVVGVTAFQANRFCRWVGKRLPTELEWERAARGPDGKDWPWGNMDPSPAYANLVFGITSGPGLLPVDELQAGASPEPERVYNLIGNVWEWTSSYRQEYGRYDPDLIWSGAPAEEPLFGLVQRGGSWNDNTLVRVTHRVSVIAMDDTRQVGIRCAKSR